MTLDPEQTRAYLNRPWGLFEQLRDQRWGIEVREAGPARAVALSWHLRELLSAAQPQWPTPEDRRCDLASHVKVRSLLARAAHAFEGSSGDS